MPRRPGGSRARWRMRTASRRADQTPRPRDSSVCWGSYILPEDEWREKKTGYGTSCGPRLLETPGLQKPCARVEMMREALRGAVKRRADRPASPGAETKTSSAGDYHADILVADFYGTHMLHSLESGGREPSEPPEQAEPRSKGTARCPDL